MTPHEKNIVFIGFMGVGKTTVGQLIAEKLGLEFVDIDKEIEKVFKMPIPRIFETFGEKSFREKEKEITIQFCNKPKPQIISVGGGAFLNEEIRNYCLDHCIVVLLDISFDAWKERLHILIEDRPKLQGASIEEIEELFYSRQHIYSNHHIKVPIENKTADSVAESIIKTFKKDRGNTLIQNKLHKIIDKLNGKPPYICTPLIGKTEEELIDEVNLAKDKQPDLIEWRVDFFSQIADVQSVVSTGIKIKEALEGIPLLFTIRSEKEGGQHIALSEKQLVELLDVVCKQNFVDLIDYELANDHEDILHIKKLASENNKLLILSAHHFDMTPTNAKLFKTLYQAEHYGADIAKLAVMPHNLSDVLRLLEITNEANQTMNIPIVTMSMADLGAVSRAIGWVFGSIITFGVGEKSSAPGQINIGDLKEVIETIRVYQR